MFEPHARKKGCRSPIDEVAAPPSVFRVHMFNTTRMMHLPVRERDISVTNAVLLKAILQEAGHSFSQPDCHEAHH